MLSYSQKQTLNKFVHQALFKKVEMKYPPRIYVSISQTQLGMKENKIITELQMTFYLSYAINELGIYVPTGKEGEYFSATINYLADHELVDLQKITLIYLHMTDSIFLAIDKKKWFNLKKINLDYNLLTNVSIKHLTQLNLPKLTSFYICSNRVDAKSCQYIAKAYWPCLQVLDCSENNIGNEGIQLLTQGKWPLLSRFVIRELQHNQTRNLKINLNDFSKCIWSNITLINLNNNKIARKGVKEIVKANFPKVKILDLQGSQINDAGMIDLTKGIWPCLEILKIRYNKISNIGINVFAKSANLQSINTIRLDLYPNMEWPIRNLSINSWNTKKSAKFTCMSLDRRKMSKSKLNQNQPFQDNAILLG